MNNQRIHRSVPPEEVERLISDYERSGLTQRAFAREKGLKLTTFQYWLYRRARSNSARMVEVPVPEAPAPVQAARYRLEFPDGKVLSFSGPVPPEELEQIYRALRD